MTETMEGQVSLFDLGTWYGKTYQERCQAETPKAKTSESSLKKQRKSQTKLPLYLDLTSGQTADASWEMGGALLGEYTMRSFGESPKEGVESRLSQILTDDPLPKYYLSARACQGILNRAAKKGKPLPDILRETLERQANDSGDFENQGGR